MLSKILTKVLTALFVLCFAFWLLFLNHVSFQEIGIARDSWSGEVWVQKNGWHVTGPQVQVASMYTLPIQVCLTSGTRILNCKLVRFKESGAQEFVTEQGFRYYNTSLASTNGCDGTCGGIERILWGYAYSGKQWSFLEILEEIAPQPALR